MLSVSQKIILKKRCSKWLYEKNISSKESVEQKLKSNWKKFINDVKNNNIANSSGETFRMIKVMTMPYGYRCVMEIPNGCKFESLEALKSEIQNSFKCVIEFYKKPFTDKFLMELIIKPLNNNKFKLEPAPDSESSAYYLFVGYSYTGKRVFIDMRDYPHLLISGKTGSGKSRLLYTLLTNLIGTCDKKSMNMYFCQVRKKDCKKFANYETTKLFAETYTETLAIVEHLNDLCKKREVLINSMGVENLFELNKKLIKEGKENLILPVVYLVLDEFSFYMVDESEDKNSPERKLKEKIQAGLYELIRVGRSSGIFLITALQRSTTTNLPSNLKASMTKITLAQENAHESKIAIDIDGAEKLTNREGLLNRNGKAIAFKVPSISPFTIRKALKNPKASLQGSDNNDDYDEEEEKEQEKVELSSETLSIISNYDESINNTNINNNNNNNNNNTPQNTITPNNVTKVKTKKKGISYFMEMDKKEIDLIKSSIEEKKSQKKGGQILLFIEKYNCLSIKQAEKIFYNHVERGYDRARKKLLELENNGKIKSTKIGAEKVYYYEREPSLHEHLIMNVYSMLIENNCNIIEFYKYYEILNGLLRPDAFIVFERNGYKYCLFLEVDYSHFTNVSKLGKYEMFFNSNEMQEKYEMFPILTILRDKKNVEFKSNKFDVIFSDFNFSNIERIFVSENKNS